MRLVHRLSLPRCSAESHLVPLLGSKCPVSMIPETSRLTEESALILSQQVNLFSQRANVAGRGGRVDGQPRPRPPCDFGLGVGFLHENQALGKGVESF